MSRKRHPIRGFFAGALLGLGVATMLLIYGKLVVSSSWPFLAVIGAFAGLGVLVGLFGPTRGKKAAAAAEYT